MSATVGQTRARLSVLAAAVLFSTGGAAIKATPLDAWQVASFRSGIAALLVLAALPVARRGWTRATLLVGLAYGATMVLFVAANKLTTAANAIFLQSTAPLYLLLLGPWLLAEPIRRRDLAFMAALAAGMAMFLAGESTAGASAPQPRAGNLVALASGLTWACTIGGLRWVEKRGASRDGGGAPAALAIGNLAACAALLPLALPVRAGGLATWLPVVYLGTVQVGLAYLLFTRGLRRLPALEVSLLVLLEPVLNPLWAWLVHGERPGLWAGIGGAAIVAATAARAIALARERRSR